MYNEIIQWVADELVLNNVINSEDIELYTYGIQQGLLILLNILTIVIVGQIFGMLLQSVAFMISYIPLRIYAGGYHARTPAGCYIGSVILIVAVLLGIKLIPWTNFICVTIALISGYVERYGMNRDIMSKDLSTHELINELTDEQIMALTANCTVSHRLDPRDYYYITSENKTYAKITFSWSWDAEPIFKGIDIIGFGWYAQMYVDTSTSYVNLYYYDTYDGSRRTELHRFTQYQTYNVSDELQLFVGGEYPKSGSGALNLYCTGKNQNLGVSYKYGHTYFGIGAPSIAAPFGIGFTFTQYVTAYPSPIVTGHIN